MSINTLYVPLFNLEECYLDKDSGLPLANGVVKFYQDSQPLNPKAVYQISGSSPDYTFTSVGTQLTLGLNGSFVDGLGNSFVPYAYPYDADGNVDLYYVTFESELGVSQFTREAVPYVNNTVSPEERTNSANELCNPQFAEVLIPSSGTTTITVSGSNTVTPIAPGWDFVTSGSGTIDVERLEPTASGVPTNPPYALRISASSGLGSSITLRQRLNNTPSLGRGGYVSGTLTAAIISGGTSSFAMDYVTSIPATTSIIPVTTISTDGAYHTISANALIAQAVNTAASTGYIDINITIPTSRNIAITSLQIVVTEDSIDIPFDQQSADRQKDFLFHYYENATVQQPKSSILAGWNFGLNPFQFIDPTIADCPAKCGYIADQTIIHQKSAVGNCQSGRTTRDYSGGLEITPHDSVGAGATIFALIQYVDPSTMTPNWGNIMSALVRARIFTSHSSSIGIKMRIIYRTTLPPTLSDVEPISAWSGTDPTFAANWTAITPINDPVYTLPNAYDSTANGVQAYPSFAFNGFQLPASTATAMTMGIVIYTTASMDPTAGTKDAIVFDKISLVQNHFALDTQAETFDESLKKCQYYYEKSLDVETQPLTAAITAGAATSMIQTNALDRPIGMDRPFKSTKRVTPTMTWYSTTSGAANTVHNYTTGTNFVVSSNVFVGKSSTGVPVLNANATDNDLMAAQWTADARMGV